MSEDTHITFVDENSIHDRFLSALAVVALIAIVVTGIYWQSLPLPDIAFESSTESDLNPEPNLYGPHSVFPLPDVDR